MLDREGMEFYFPVYSLYTYFSHAVMTRLQIQRHDYITTSTFKLIISIFIIYENWKPKENYFYN